MELLKHELYKIANRKIIWIAAAFFTIVTIFFIHNMSGLYSEYGNMGDFYRSTYQGHEGTVNSQTLTTAQTDQEKLNNVDKSSIGANETRSIEELRQMNFDQAVLNAKANQDTRVSRLNEYQQAIKSASQKFGENSFAYRNAVFHYNMVKQLILPGVYFNYPWQNIIDFPVVLGFLILVAMILLGVSPIFSDEYATGVDALILSSKWGKRKLAGIKITAGIIYCTVTALLFALINMVGYFAILGTFGGGAPLQSIYKYLASPYSFTIGQFFLLETLIYIVGGVCFGLFVMLVSALSKNVLIPFFTCGCLVGLTAGLKAVDIVLPKPFSWLEDFSYSELMRVSGLFSEYKTYNIFGHPMLYFPLAIVVFSIISIIILLLTLRIFKNHQIENA